MSTILGLDIGSDKVCAIIASKNEDEVKVLGSGVAKSKGIKKGVITSIEHSSNSIKQAVLGAVKVAGTSYDKTVVSVCGAYSKNIKSSGVVNIPNQEIGIEEINRVITMANHNANIPGEFEKVHVIPTSFKIDDQDFIENPLGMNGNRLEVTVNIVTIQKSVLNNLKKSVELAGVRLTNIVLSAYASAIAVLNEDEKELGSVIIDMGASTADLVVYSENTIKHQSFLGVGSFHITNDLSMALHTPLSAAEQVKLQYGSLKVQNSDLIELPMIGDSETKVEVSLEIVRNVISARVEETLMILAKMVEDSGYKTRVGAGVVLTGGMTKLGGIRDLASIIFDKLPVRIAKPRKLEGLSDKLDLEEFSTVIGLVLYGFGEFIEYEMDSNKNLRHKNETIENGINTNSTEIDDILNMQKYNNSEAKRENNQKKEEKKEILHQGEPKESIATKIKGIYNSLMQMF